MTERRQFSTFKVGHLFFGVEVEKVQEVIRYQEMTRVPLADRIIRGLINLRGQIVTAVDLRRRLQLPDRCEDALPMNVVVRHGGGPVSLLVDEIGDVLEVDAGSFENAPDTLTSQARQLICGVYKLEGNLLHVLNTEKVLDVSSAHSGAAGAI